MKIERVWAMPNKQTFGIEPINDLILEEGKRITPLDPFPFDYKEDAVEYMNTFSDETFDFGLFDPPYSPRQLKESYKNIGNYDTKISTWSNWKNLSASKIKAGGKTITFGWNTNGLGKSRGFEITRILLVAHGSMHNDTICTVEKKVQERLI